MSNLPVAAGLTWHWSGTWKSLWYWNGSGGTGDCAAADFGCVAGQSGRRVGGDGCTLREGNGRHGDKKIQTGLQVPALRASPHSHCWPGWHVFGPVTALGPVGGPTPPAPSETHEQAPSWRARPGGTRVAGRSWGKVLPKLTAHQINLRTHRDRK